MRSLVFYRRRTGEMRRLRVGSHSKPGHVNVREFRISLVAEYNRTNKRVERISLSRITLEEWMDNQERIELLRELKREMVEAMRREEPDDGEEVHLETQEILVRAVERTIENKIFDIESA